MKLESQVCSLELAKRLKELGVEQDSYFFYEYYTDSACRLSPASERGYAKIEIAAFTVGEIGELLPSIIKINKTGYYLTMDIDRCPFYSDVPSTKEIYSGADYDGDTEADARAKMLIYLIENGLIKVEP